MPGGGAESAVLRYGYVILIDPIAGEGDALGIWRIPPGIILGAHGEGIAGDPDQGGVVFGIGTWYTGRAAAATTRGREREGCVDILPGEDGDRGRPRSE